MIRWNAPRSRPPFWDRFWSKVDASGDCWEWTARRHRGYGIFTAGGAHHSAHRASWELLVGIIPEGMQIDHLCRNRGCVNPDHLEPVTPRENTRRGFPAKATHCIYGHRYTPENTYYQSRPNGRSRSCVECRHDRHRVARVAA